ncbi:MAG: hypothetical protein AAF434_06550 [Pseudomonadota bacterium]
MNGAALGILFAFSFVLLESVQFVYFGGLFQHVDSFLIGFLVFGTTVVVFVSWTAIFKPEQLKIALSMRGQLLAVNLGAVVTFTAYLLSVQLLEPAITYTISGGTMPIAAYVFYKIGMREGEPMRNRFEAAGNFLIFVAIIFLAFITVGGMSGFVRGDTGVAILGVLLAIIDGVFFTLILVYSQRLSKAGVGPTAVLGIRLPLYVLVTGVAATAGFNSVGPVSTSDLVLYTVIGLLLSVPPLYLLQKAVATVSTLTLSAITAIGPLVIFLLQIVEGRVDYKTVTLIGLSFYTAGAIFSAYGAVRASTSQS